MVRGVFIFFKSDPHFGFIAHGKSYYPLIQHIVAQYSRLEMPSEIRFETNKQLKKQHQYQISFLVIIACVLLATGVWSQNVSGKVLAISCAIIACAIAFYKWRKGSETFESMVANFLNNAHN